MSSYRRMHQVKKHMSIAGTLVFLGITLATICNMDFEGDLLT